MTRSREIAHPRPLIWRALTELRPYCAVCDVSYVFEPAGEEEPRGLDLGVSFTCVSGRLDGAEPPSTAPRGEITDWEEGTCFASRLELTPESWLTRVHLQDADNGGTVVTITLTWHPKVGSRLVHLTQRRSLQRLLEETVELELARVPDHVRQVGPVAD
ncbi:SRPBCC family protein [Trujillonella humicola]|uniref:SRPBCC family protein n=1 Tax=Trujillonella humicola TaxID=3383699 RepID=UPI003905F464